MNNTLLDLLKEELRLLNEAASILDYSYKKCKKVGIKEEYYLEELDQFEAFTSRFARLSDLIIQKVFRLIDKIELEDEGSVRDRINRAEKKELIEKSDTFVQIRIVRNDIAHEYRIDTVKEIFKKVLELTPYLLRSVKRTEEYCNKKVLEQSHQEGAKKGE